jgi:Type IV secretion system pilin
MVSAAGNAMIRLFQNFAQSGPQCGDGNFFDFPTWYRYLGSEYSSVTKRCEVQFDLMKGGKFNGGDILLVGLSIIDILIRIAALVAVGYVIYGGIKYITSQGSPDGTKNAQNTILHAVIGVAIAVIAAAVVAFVGNQLIPN